MEMTIGIVILAVLLIMWWIAWRNRPILGLGMTIGVLLAGVIAAVVGQPDFDKVPVWLPPLAPATVAVTLLVFGILAWVWGDEKPGAEKENQAPPPSH